MPNIESLLVGKPSGTSQRRFTSSLSRRHSRQNAMPANHGQCPTVFVASSYAARARGVNLVFLASLAENAVTQAPDTNGGARARVMVRPAPGQILPESFAVVLATGRAFHEARRGTAFPRRFMENSLPPIAQVFPCLPGGFTLSRGPSSIVRSKASRAGGNGEGE